MNCKICNSNTNVIFSRKVLNKYDVSYHQCSICKFIQTDEPFWIDEAYISSINIEDTGLVDRNILFAKRTSTLLYFLFNKDMVFFDYAAGYGLFVRLMRDYGFNFFWNDPYTENIFAKGFEYKSEEHKDIELVTAFECFEHFNNPVAEIEKLLTISDNILFSTEIFKGTAPEQEEWDYYGFSHGQHVSFYSLKSLYIIKNKFGLDLYTNGKSFHLFTKKPLNNFIFNTLIKLSLSGLPLFIKKMMGSKTTFDSHIMRDKR